MVSGLLAAVLLAAAPARAEDKVQFRLNWILYGFHTPFYLGLERGYYRDEGIDLTIGEGQGYADAPSGPAAGNSARSAATCRARTAGLHALTASARGASAP